MAAAASDLDAAARSAAGATGGAAAGERVGNSTHHHLRHCHRRRTRQEEVAPNSSTCHVIYLFVCKPRRSFNHVTRNSCVPLPVF